MPRLSLIKEKLIKQNKSKDHDGPRIERKIPIQQRAQQLAPSSVTLVDGENHRMIRLYRAPASHSNDAGNRIRMDVGSCGNDGVTAIPDFDVPGIADECLPRNPETLMMDNLCYLMRGNPYLDRLNTFVRYDTLTNRWQGLAPMNRGRHKPLLARLGDDIYVIGGIRIDFKREHSSAIDRYNSKTNTWERLNDLPMSLLDGAACEVKDRLYISGGWFGGRKSDLILRYNSKSDTWSNVGSMQHERHGHAMCSFGGKIYILGGGTDNSVDVYDPDSRECTLMHIHGEHPVIWFKGRVYLNEIGLFYFVGETDHNLYCVDLHHKRVTRVLNNEHLNMWSALIATT